MTYRTESLGTSLARTSDWTSATTSWTLLLLAVGVAALSAIHACILANGILGFWLNNPSPGDQFYDFTHGIDRSILNVSSGPVVTSPKTGAVPEPACWAIMILGIGAIDYAMRRSARPAPGSGGSLRP